ncbi:hypothetical protein [Streptomyces thermospinosisporus]|uniref:hypothetical protein n=1 Tax=Streptomyces thermospinosisporus TaxID=161482 RepID=UPI0031D82485
MVMPAQGGLSALLFVGTAAVVGSAACAAALPCPCPDMAVAGAAWLSDIAMPGVITCAAEEGFEPIAAPAVSW